MMPKLWTKQRISALLLLILGGLLQTMAIMGSAYFALQLLSHGQNRKFEISLVAITFFHICIIIIQKRGAERFAQSWVHSLRAAFFAHVIQEPSNARSSNHGLIMTRIVNDFSAVKIWLSDGLVGLCVSIVSMFAAIAFLGLIAPWILVPITISVIITALIHSLFIWPLVEAIRAVRKQRGSIAAKASIALNGRLSFLSFGKIGSITRSMERKSSALVDQSIRRASWSGALLASTAILMPIIAFTTLIFPFENSVRQNNLETLGLVLFVIGLITAQFSIISRAIDYYLAYAIAMQKLKQLFKKPSLDPHSEKQKIKRSSKGRTFKLNKFPIGHGEQHISANFSPEKPTLLTGLSSSNIDSLMMAGAGLTKIMPNQIFIEDKDVCETQRRDWLRSVVFISPRLPPVKGTVMRNLSIGKPSKMSTNKIIKIANSFNIPEDLISFEIRQDTILSQDLHMAIIAARAIIRKAPVILLHYDQLLQNDMISTTLFNALDKQKTTLIIASSDIKIQDKIRARVSDLCIIDTSHNWGN